MTDEPREDAPLEENEDEQDVEGHSGLSGSGLSGSGLSGEPELSRSDEDDEVEGHLLKEGPLSDG